MALPMRCQRITKFLDFYVGINVYHVRGLMIQLFVSSENNRDFSNFWKYNSLRPVG